MRQVLFFLALFAVTACMPADDPRMLSKQAPTQDARILVIGDSMMAWNRLTGGSIPQQISKALGEPVADRSKVGARVNSWDRLSALAGYDINRQFQQGDWDVVVMNGAGNDLYFRCNCHSCDDEVNQLISEDGQTGDIPGLMRRISRTGATAIYAGYHRTGGLGGPYDRCVDELDEIDARVAKLVSREPNLLFANMQDVFPPKSQSYYAFDGVHPSRKGSRVYAKRLAAFITTHR